MKRYFGEQTPFWGLVESFQFSPRHRMSAPSDCLLPPDCPACGYPGCKGEPGVCPAVSATPPESSDEEVFTQADPLPQKKRAITVEEILHPVSVEQVLREEVKQLKEDKSELSQAVRTLEREVNKLSDAVTTLEARVSYEVSLRKVEPPRKPELQPGSAEWAEWCKKLGRRPTHAEIYPDRPFGYCGRECPCGNGPDL